MSDKFGPKGVLELPNPSLERGDVLWSANRSTLIAKIRKTQGTFSYKYGLVLGYLNLHADLLRNLLIASHKYLALPSMA